MKPSQHYKRWEWFDEHTLKNAQQRKYNLSITALILGRTYAASASHASILGFLQRPRWSSIDLDWLYYRYNQGATIDDLCRIFPTRSRANIKRKLRYLGLTHARSAAAAAAAAQAQSIQYSIPVRYDGTDVVHSGYPAPSVHSATLRAQWPVAYPATQASV